MNWQSKKCKSGVFFLRHDEADDFLEAEQSGDENGSAVDGKRDGKSNHPIDIQLLDKESDHGYSGKENKNVKPITAANLQFQDAFGEQVLQECRHDLDAEAGAGCSDRLESWYDEEVQQDIDDDACGRHEVELLEASVGSEQGSENVSC